MCRFESVAQAKEKYASMEGIDAFGAMLIHNHVYKDSQSEDHAENKKRLKDVLEVGVNGIIGPDAYTKSAVGDKEHADNIQRLVEYVNPQCGGFLLDGKLRFGTAQKYLNVELKLRWCKGECLMPPHCPFDSYVLGALAVDELKKDGVCGNWTKCDHRLCYDAWVRAFKENDENKERLLKWIKVPDAKSMSDWEVVYWLMKTNNCC